MKLHSIRPGSESVRPSRAERPGLPRLLAALVVDPWWVVFQLIMAAAEGITRGIIKAKQRRKATKAKPPAKAPAKSKKGE